MVWLFVLVLAIQAALNIHFFRVIMKLRREKERLETRFWDGEASTESRHIIDAPAILRLHLDQDR